MLRLIVLPLSVVVVAGAGLVGVTAFAETVPNTSMLGITRPAVDSHDRLVWTFDEASGASSFTNSGAAGDTVGNTLSSVGTQYAGMAGVFGGSLYMPNTTYLKSATTGTLDKGGGVSQVTMSAWVQSTAASTSS